MVGYRADPDHEVLVLDAHERRDVVRVRLVEVLVLLGPLVVVERVGARVAAAVVEVPADARVPARRSSVEVFL